jgi:hypothetical protein
MELEIFGDAPLFRKLSIGLLGVGWIWCHSWGD